MYIFIIIESCRSSRSTSLHNVEVDLHVAYIRVRTCTTSTCSTSLALGLARGTCVLVESTCRPTGLDLQTGT